MIGISFFTGAMGLDLGLERSGVEFKLAVEKDKWAQKTIRANRPLLPVLGDITQITAGDIRSAAGLDGVEPDIVAGGPPCQAWSSAGKRGGLSDARGAVSFKYAELVIELSPKYFVMENVRGLMSVDDGKPLRQVLSLFKGAGYDISFHLYNAANYGVPQIRERLIIIGSQNGKVGYLTPTNAKDGVMGCHHGRPSRSP